MNDKKRVLIVDDAVVMRMMLKDILARGGFEIAGEAPNGPEAIEKYRRLRPDLVTMDIVMPGMDGIAAAKQIIATDPEAKIIMCTSMGQEALAKEALEAGAKATITKPFRPSDILDVVKAVLR
jgi:two-component system chemotaxis response regulator CheY